MRSLLQLAVLSIPTCLACYHAGAAPNKEVVRIAAVHTPVYTGLLDGLLKDFRKETGLKVEIYRGTDVYERARSGMADIVISHYGKPGADEFVLNGFGFWPKTVFSNQAVIIGPGSDPANIRGLTSGAEAMRRISKAKAPFIAQNLPGIDYLTTVFWEASGRPHKKGWFQKTDRAKGKAVKFADQKNAYIMWGAFPFLRFKAKHRTSLEIMVSADSSMQRVMATILVNPKKVKDVNFDGAKALEGFLLRPQIQARIAAYRWKDSNLQLWWPAARHNNPGILPK